MGAGSTRAGARTGAPVRRPLPNGPLGRSPPPNAGAVARTDLTATGRNGAVPSPPGARPVAPTRRANPRLVIVALLLGLLVAAGALKAMSVASKRTPALVVTQDVAAGTRITPEMLGTVPLASDGDVGALGAGDRAMVVGRTARHRLRAGDLVRAGDVTEDAPLAADQRRVGLRLERGRFPYDLEAGTRVRVVTEDGGSFVALVARFAKDADGDADLVLVVGDTDADALARGIQSGKAALVAEAAP